MAKEFAEAFYHSARWKKVRKAYVSQTLYCERCKEKGELVPGAIVHHKIHLTPQNIGDERVTCNFNNLELLCTFCHREEHNRDIAKGLKNAKRSHKRYFLDSNGKVQILDDQ